MRKLALSCLSLVAAAVVLASPAPATTIMTFEGVVPDTGARIPGTYYFENGFNLTSSGVNGQYNGIFGKDAFGVNSNGTAVFGWCNQLGYCEPVIRLSHWGAYFDLNSVDYSNLRQASGAGAIPGGLAIVVTGHRAGGWSITQTLPVDQDLWNTADLSGFTNLTWATFNVELPGPPFSNGDLAIDNVNLTFVPEPGSLALVFGGLAMASFLGRRRRG